MAEEAATIVNIWPVLLPVIVGGALALLGGVLGPAISHWLSSRSANQTRRAERFEELFSLLHQQDDWLNTVRMKNAWGEKVEIPTEPLPKAIAISALYFPQFLDQLKDFEAATWVYTSWTTEAGQRRLAGNLKGVNEGFSEMYSSYRTKFVEVRSSIANYAVLKRGKV